MATNILMPALSPTMTEGTLARWLKKEGEAVKAGDIIAEIETDKATMEVEAVDEGILGKIVVAGGTAGVKVNDVIAVLVEEGESADAAPPPSPRRPRRRRRPKRRPPRRRSRHPRRSRNLRPPHQAAASSRPRSPAAWRNRRGSICPA